jgi:hypothetical protein
LRSGQFPDLLGDALHGGALGHHVVEPRRLVVDRERGTARQPADFQSSIDHQHQGIGVVERLVEVVEGPGLHGQDGGCGVVVAGDDDDRDVARGRPDVGDEVDAGSVGKLEIEQDHRGAFPFHEGQTGGGGLGRQDPVARPFGLRFEVQSQALEEQRIVVDQKKGVHACVVGPCGRWGRARDGLTAGPRIAPRRFCEQPGRTQLPKFGLALARERGYPSERHEEDQRPHRVVG